jgi:hypothetical protein
MFSVRTSGLAAAIMALAIPAIGQAQVSQTGKWSMAPGKSSELFVNWSSNVAKVMVTVCVDSGHDVIGNVEVTVPATPTTRGGVAVGTILPTIKSGLCRTALASVPANGIIILLPRSPPAQPPQPPQASGTYTISSPLP